MAVIRMSRFGRSLSSRGAGREAYLAISSEIARRSGIVEFDFSGVEAVSNSFADAVFGRLAFETGMKELRKLTTFSNVDRTSACVIRSVMDLRESQRAESRLAAV